MKTPETTRMATPLAVLVTGDEVEVSSDEDGLRGAYFESTVVRSMPKVRRYTVDYDAIVDEADEARPLRETVEARHVRPRPPRSNGPGGGGEDRRFALHQVVDALYNDAWWVGVVSKTSNGRQGRYSIYFPVSREKIEFGVEHLRRHLEWVDGEWITPGCERKFKMPYEVGTQVEVARLKDNAVVSWFSAIVVKTISKKNFLVEYMKSIDGTKLLKEIVDLQYLRPCPPLETETKFDLLDEVEALHINGWWPGVITKISGKSSYMVKLVHVDEEIEFKPRRLRHRYDFVGGQWVRKSQNLSGMEFGQGKVVEVSSDEEGFSGAWFRATVVKSIGKDKFLIEYQDLKTDDETEFLRQTVDSRHIRPVPPEVPVIGTFSCLEEVDAMYKDGWLVGVISKVLRDRRYVVYFRHSGEELEFEHKDIRLHHDWIGGKWIRTSQNLL